MKIEIPSTKVIEAIEAHLNKEFTKPVKILSIRQVVYGGLMSPLRVCYELNIDHPLTRTQEPPIL